MKETSLWKWLKKALLQIDNLDMTRIENGSGEGTPDVEGFMTDQFWIELKVCDRPKRVTTIIRPRFEPQQIPWLKRRCSVGGKAWCLIQIGSGHEAKRYLIHGSKIGLLEHGATEDLFLTYSVCLPHDNQKQILHWAVNY